LFLVTESARVPLRDWMVVEIISDKLAKVAMVQVPLN
jgi:hypothetical protein